MYPLLISYLASISTVIGSFLIFLKNKNNILCFSLSFASGVMLTMTIFDLLPEAFMKISKYFYIVPSMLILSIFFSGGVVVSFLIDKYIPTDDCTYKLGLINLIAIIIHNIPEGIATYIAASVDIKLGITLAISIALHNIPEGIIIAIPIYYSTSSRLKAITYTLIAGLSEFFGSLITLIFLKKYINELFIGIVLAIIAGIMFQISIYELFPSAKDMHNKNLYIYFMIGILIMLISIILI